MIEYELRKVALEHALTLKASHSGNVDCIIGIAKRLEDYLLFGMKHRDTQKRATPGGLTAEQYRGLIGQEAQSITGALGRTPGHLQNQV